MGSSKSAKAEAPNPTATAEQTIAAREATDPRAQALAFRLASGPGGMQDYTQLQKDVRSNIFGEEEAVKNALLKNLISGYENPNYIPPEMQAGVNAARQTAQNRLTEAMRTRANLGGGLYGGRTAQSEAQSVGELQSGFAEQDYNRMLQNRAMQIQATLGALAQLYPQLGIQSTPFETAAPAGGQVYGTQASLNQFNAQQQAAANAAKQQQLMQLGQMAGMAIAAPFTGGASLAGTGSLSTGGQFAAAPFASTTPTAKQLAFLG